MNSQPYADPLSPAFFWLDTGEQEDELDDDAREEKQEKEDGDEEPDYDLELQERLNKH